MLKETDLPFCTYKGTLFYLSAVFNLICSEREFALWALCKYGNVTSRNSKHVPRYYLCNFFSFFKMFFSFDVDFLHVLFTTLLLLTFDIIIYHTVSIPISLYLILQVSQQHKIFPVFLFSSTCWSLRPFGCNTELLILSSTKCSSRGP